MRDFIEDLEEIQKYYIHGPRAVTLTEHALVKVKEVCNTRPTLTKQCRLVLMRLFVSRKLTTLFLMLDSRTSRGQRSVEDLSLELLLRSHSLSLLAGVAITLLFPSLSAAVAITLLFLFTVSCYYTPISFTVSRNCYYTPHSLSLSAAVAITLLFSFTVSCYYTPIPILFPLPSPLKLRTQKLFLPARSVASALEWRLERKLLFASYKTKVN